jgi:hypothetical protein
MSGLKKLKEMKPKKESLFVDTYGININHTKDLKCLNLNISTKEATLKANQFYILYCK